MNASPAAISSFVFLIIAFGGVLCITTLITLGVIYMGFRSVSKSREAWKSFAAKNGYTFQQSSPLGYGTVTGQYQGRAVNLQAYTTGTQRSRHTWTVATVTVDNPKGLSVSIKANASYSEVEKGFGGQGSSVTIEEFSRKFVVQSNPPGLAESTLKNNPDLRQRILEATASELTYKDQAAAYQAMGLRFGDRELNDIFRLVSDFADAVERG